MTMIKSEHIMVNGVRMHYLTEGEGRPVLFLHGVPASSHMWEAVMPRIATRAKCIAVDLIGMGESDKPHIEYAIEDHVHFLKGFIEAMNLTDVALVMNRWGSIVGLDYVSQHADRVSGLVFIEAYLRIEKNMQDIPLIFSKLRALKRSQPEKLKQMLTEAFWRALEDDPYVNSKSPVIPIIKHYSEGLEKSQIPKLLLYTDPGFLTTQSTIKWAMQNLPNLTAVDLGVGAHDFSDTMPLKFAESLLSWL